MAAVRRRSIAFAATVVLAGLGACGSDDPPRAGSGGGDLTTTSLEEVGVSVGELERFSTSVAETPYWATVRRAGPMPFASQLEDTRGAVRGEVIGFEAGRPRDLSSMEAIGFEDPVGDGAVFVRQDVHLMVKVTATVGRGAEGLRVGDVVAVPIPIWLSGRDGLSGDDFAAEVVARLAGEAPIGAPTLVLIADVLSTEDGSKLDTAGDSDFNSLSGVVFEAADGTLVGLDYVVGPNAEKHYGVDTLDDLASKAQEQS
jgi:hypothetical protein